MPISFVLAGNNSRLMPISFISARNNLRLVPISFISARNNLPARNAILLTIFFEAMLQIQIFIDMKRNCPMHHTLFIENFHQFCYSKHLFGWRGKNTFREENWILISLKKLWYLILSRYGILRYWYGTYDTVFTGLTTGSSARKEKANFTNFKFLI